MFGGGSWAPGSAEVPGVPRLFQLQLGWQRGAHPAWQGGKDGRNSAELSTAQLSTAQALGTAPLAAPGHTELEQGWTGLNSNLPIPPGSPREGEGEELEMEGWSGTWGENQGWAGRVV